MRIKSFVLDRSANLKGFPTEIIFVPRWKAIAIKGQIGRKILQLHLRLYSQLTDYKNYFSNNPLLIHYLKRLKEPKDVFSF